MDSGLLHELDVDEVGLGAVGLPEGVGVVVSELLDSVACLGRGEGPYCLCADLSAVLVVGGRGVVMDVGWVRKGVRRSFIL